MSDVSEIIDVARSDFSDNELTQLHTGKDKPLVKSQVKQVRSEKDLVFILLTDGLIGDSCESDEVKLILKQGFPHFFSKGW